MENIEESEEYQKIFQEKLDLMHFYSKFGAKYVFEIQTYLTAYLLHLEGKSYREISDIDKELPSHTKIMEYCKQGEIYFDSLFRIMVLINHTLHKKTL